MDGRVFHIQNVDRMKQEHVDQVMILADVQISMARIIHDEKKFHEINEQINKVKQMILNNNNNDR